MFWTRLTRAMSWSTRSCGLRTMSCTCPIDGTMIRSSVTTTTRIKTRKTPITARTLGTRSASRRRTRGFKAYASTPAAKNVSSTPLTWRTKATRSTTPSASAMYCRYVETRSFLADIRAPIRSLRNEIYQHLSTRRSRHPRFTPPIPLCIIPAQYERGKRTESPTCWGSAGSAGSSADRRKGYTTRPDGRSCRKQLHRAARGQKGEAGRSLQAAAIYGRFPAGARRRRASLRSIRPDQGLGHDRARGPYRPEQRRSRHGAGGGRRGQSLHPYPSCEPHRARLSSGGREPRRNGTAGQEPLGQRGPRPPLQRRDTGEDSLLRDGRRGA